MLFQAHIYSFDKKSRCHLFSLSTGRAPEGESFLIILSDVYPHKTPQFSSHCAMFEAVLVT